MGKGSSPRPLSVSRKQFDENFDRIFSQNDEEDQGLELVGDVADLPIEYIAVTEEPIEKK
jgi:uncharacterized membrane protein